MDFCKQCLVEQYDEKYVNLLMNIGHNEVERIMRERDTFIEGEKTSVKEQTERIRGIAKEAKINKYRRDVYYKYSKKNPHDGRLYSCGASLQNIMGCFRGLLSGATAIDFDAINCHPVLLEYLCLTNNIFHPILSQYIQNRDKFIQEFCNADNITRSEAKKLFLKSINSQHQITKKNKKELVKYKPFLEFDKEIKSIQIDFGVLYEEELKKIKRRETDNILGKLMSRILNLEENKMLQTACNSIQETYQVMSLVFDGLMVYRYNDGKHVDEDAVINALNKSTDKWKIKWAVKEPDYSIQELVENMSLDNGAVLYGDTEAHLVNLIFNEYFNYKIYNHYGQSLMLINRQWVSNPKTIKNCVYKIVSNTKGYVRVKKDSGDYDWKLLSQTLSGANNITDAILKNIPENSKFMDTLEKQCIFKISFKNGYWDFKQNTFIEYEDGDGFNTINMIDRDFKYIEKYDPIRKAVFENILYKMFCVDDETSQDYPIMENFLYHLARAMAGIITDKIWFMLVGKRDSAKGVFDGLLRNAFGSYIGNFNSSAFNLDCGNKQDPDLKQKFILKNRYCRLAVSQENSDNWKDGDLIKKVSSGGDTIEARGLYENSVSFKTPCKYMFVGNNSARVKPADALQTQFFYQMRGIFVNDLNDITDKLENIRYYKKDDNIKINFINNDDVLNAFCSIIFDYYTRTDTYYPKHLKAVDDLNVNVFQETKRLFKITTDKNHFITNESLKAIYNANKDIYDNFAHLKSILRGMGAVDHTFKKSRGLRFVVEVRVCDGEGEVDGDDDE